MARKLTETVRAHGVEVRHAQATRILGAVLDENQHPSSWFRLST